MSVKDYNKEASLNVSISGINIAEGCAPSGINDAIRQLMADVKEESEAQAEAVAGAESTASSQVSALDSTLRALISQEVAKCLKTSGGMLTGNLDFDGRSITRLRQIELTGTTDGGYLDFHFGGSTSDYTSRIIETAIGRLDIGAPNGVLVNSSPVLTSAGGTLYAPLKFYDLGSAYYDGSAASESMNVGLVEENVGRSAVLSLRTTRASDAPGSFWLGARNAKVANYLTGTTDGWLGWRGYDVLTSAHGLLMNGSNVAVGTVSGNTFTLPAGGTWAYTYHRTTHGDNAGGSGVAAGGATITTAEGPTTYFAIRIA